MAAIIRTESGFEREDRRVRHLLEQDRATRYEVGDLLARIRDSESWVLGGFKSFTAYLHSLRGPTVRTLQRYMAFADAVPKEVALAFDRERVSLALELLPPDKEGNVVVSVRVLEKLRVDVVRDGVKTQVPFAKATADELADAVVDKQGRLLPAPPALAGDREKLAGRLGGDVEVVVRRRKKVAGLAIFVPSAQVAQFLKRLK